MSPASESQIAAFEALLGSRLPADYRDYLGTVNGGTPPAPCYHGDVTDLEIQSVFSLLDDEQAGLLWERRNANLPETLRRVLLPVARATGGDRLMLSLVNGEVFLHDHEFDSYSRIEDSFTAVLQKLSES
jgi:hypothetical protein